MLGRFREHEPLQDLPNTALAARRVTNLIVIVSDTFRRDHLGCCGNGWIHTENIDRFAERRVTAQRLLDRSVEFFESLGMAPELIENRRRFPG